MSVYQRYYFIVDNGKCRTKVWCKYNKYHKKIPIQHARAAIYRKVARMFPDMFVDYRYYPGCSRRLNTWVARYEDGRKLSDDKKKIVEIVIAAIFSLRDASTLTPEPTHDQSE